MAKTRYVVSVVVQAETQDEAVDMAKFYVNSGNVLIRKLEEDDKR